MKASNLTKRGKGGGNEKVKERMIELLNE